MNEPIAIIGMACRFPGSAGDVEGFWDMLCQGESAVSDVPSDRFKVDSFYHPDPARLDMLSTKRAHFVSGDILAFDAGFFGISAAEAASMDPQCRIILEVAYHALENAGLPMEKVAGSDASVYMGSFGTRDFDSYENRDPQNHSKHHATGAGVALLANRISHFFDLQGPSLTLDTACSSSLYALHLACQSLRLGESSVALVGGSNIILTPDGFMLSLSNGGFLSPDGLSKSFDHKADGYGRGEGFGMVVLKSLSRALADRDPIRSVIRATAINTNGKTPSLTQPSLLAQIELIRRVYCQAGLDQSLTRYVEAHGTGTKVGDPIEAEAIGQAFDGHERQTSLFVGSAKSNVGHLEGASGIVALIKTALVVERGLIPPIAWLEKVNSKIHAEQHRLKFPTQLEQWQGDGVRRASINNFGYGGANAHAVLDDGRQYHPSQSDSLGCLDISGEDDSTDDHSSRPCLRRTKLLVLSAADTDGVTRGANQLQVHLKKLDASARTFSYLDALCMTLSDRRSRLRWRSYVSCDSIDQLEDRLRKGEISRPFAATRDNQIGFIFTGQGAQWVGMGRYLGMHPKFQESVQQADIYLKYLGCSWSAYEMLFGGAYWPVASPEYSQPLTTVLQVALVDLLEDWGIKSTWVIGHSSGEIAAAYCCGAISREDAWRLSFLKGYYCSLPMLGSLRPQGMLAVALSAAECSNWIHDNRLDNKVHVACINSQKSTTLAGLEKPLHTLKGVLERNGILVRLLNVSNAYHSVHMEAIAKEYCSALGQISPRSTFKGDNVRFYSTVDGCHISPSVLRTANYWERNMVLPVNFEGALKLRFADFGDLEGQRVVMLEIGPHPALQRPITDITADHSELSKDSCVYISTLQRRNDAANGIMHVAGELFAKGIAVDLAAVNRLQRCDLLPLTDLPQYPFNHARSFKRQNHWSENFNFRKKPRHELLGDPDVDWNAAQPSWRNVLRIREHPWTQDHVVDSLVVYPASGFLVAAIQALVDITTVKVGAIEFEDVTFVRALPINSPPNETELRTSLQQSQSSLDPRYPWYQFHVLGRTNENWFRVCSGKIKAVGAETPSNDEETILKTHQDRIESCHQTISKQQYYSNLRKSGLGFGPTFQSLKRLRYSETDVGCASIERSALVIQHESQPYQPYIIHPVTLDAFIQLSICNYSEGSWRKTPPLVPYQIRKMWISASLTDLDTTEDARISSDLTFRGLREFYCQVTMSDAGLNRTLIDAKDFTFLALGSLSGDLSVNEFRTDPISFSWDWKADLSLLQSPQRENYLETKASNRYSGCSRGTSDEVSQRIEALVKYFIAGNLPSISQAAVPEDKPHLMQYADWMIQVARLPGCSDKQSMITDTEVTQLMQHKDELDPSTNIVLTVGEHLLGILSGQVDPLVLLFEHTLAQDWYSHELGRAINHAVCLLDHWTHKQPNLRICEVGAGTGSLTIPALDALKASTGIGSEIYRFSEYLFSDISPAFITKAKERLGQSSSYVQFQTLDISQDPSGQGFETHSYDIVVAASVVHATPNLLTSLQNIRKLLKPGGRLLLLEPCNEESLHYTFVAGITAGWWLQEDRGDSNGPLISESRWDRFLKSAGFSGIDYSLQDSKDPQFRRSVTMVSSVPIEQEVPRHLGMEVRPLVILDQATGSDRSVAAELRKRLEDSGLQCEILRLSQLLSADMRGRSIISLLELDSTVIDSLHETEFSGIMDLLMQAENTIWVTRGSNLSATRPDSCQVEGLTRAICTERNMTAVVLLSLGSTCIAKDVAKYCLEVHQHITSSEVDHLETQYTEVDGVLCVGRIMPNKQINELACTEPASKELEEVNLGSQSERNLQVHISDIGNISTVHFQKASPYKKYLNTDEIEVQVMAAGLGFHDLLIALGQIPGTSFGTEAAGIVTKAGIGSHLQPGDRVLCLAANAASLYCYCSSSEAFKIPNNMTFETAASLPLSTGSAYVSIHRIAKVRPSESVLIHSAAGAVGQIAIQLCQRIGAEVFVTAGTQEKRDFLQAKYSIPSSHISPSRDLLFKSSILSATNQRGVDVILSPHSGEMLKASFDVLAPLGRYVQMGPPRGPPSFHAEKSLFAKAATFSSLNWTLPEIRALLAFGVGKSLVMISEAKLSGPYPLKCFPASKAADALATIQKSETAAKIVLTFGEGQTFKARPDLRAACQFKSHATYVITGAYGGIGRAVISWMLQCGARNFLLISRSALSEKKAAETLVRRIRASGAIVKTAACDITNNSKLVEVLEAVKRTMPPIKGCIHGAMVLKSSLAQNMSSERYRAALRPKVQGSWNLHQLLPVDLDFFIMLSSVAGVYGMAGDSNYAAGNTYQDALARHRVMQGLKGLSLNLGLVLGAGHVSESQESSQALQRLGFRGFPIQQLLLLLSTVCDPQSRYGTTLETAQLLFGVDLPKNLQPHSVPGWMSRPTFRMLQKIKDQPVGDAGAEPEAAVPDYEILLRNAETLQDATKVLMEGLRGKLSAIMSLPEKEIDLERPMYVAGIDSLMAIEVRYWLLQLLKIEVPVQRILQDESARDFCKQIVADLRG